MKSVFILTLANIRHKKSSFAGVVFLIFMIVFSFIPTLSNATNTKKAIDEGFKIANFGDSTVLILDDLYTGDIENSMRAYDGVREIDKQQFISVVDQEFFDERESKDINFLRAANDSDRIFNEDFTGFAKGEIVEQGEIYLPYKVKDLEWIKIGAKFKLKVGDRLEEFTVAGFFDDPIFRPRTWWANTALISTEDYDRLVSEASHIYDTDRKFLLYDIIQVHLEEGTDLETFKDDMERSCNLISNADRVCSIDDFKKSGELYADIGTKLVYVFEALLMAVVLITMHNNISSAIEMDYTDLGVLKSQGFDIMKIRLIFIFQYLIAAIIGSILGMLGSIPLTGGTVRLFMTVTCVLTDNTIVIKESLILIAAVIVICTLFVFLATAKIKKISPVAAIRGGKGDVYFDPKFKNSIRPKPLLLSMSLRKLLTNKKNYVGTFLTVALLVYFMVSITVMTSGVDVNKLFSILGGEITVSSSDIISDDVLEEISKTARSIDKDSSVHAKGGVVMMVEGESVSVHKFSDIEDSYKVKDGREIRYDNEILMTDVLCDEFDKGIGDSVSVKYRNESREYVISGVFETVNEYGRAIMMSKESAEDIGFTEYSSCFIDLADESKTAEVMEAVSELHNLRASEYEQDPTISAYLKIINVMLDTVTYVIYGVSLVFAVVVVMLVCHRSFLRERTDIGICKSLGFRVNALRTEFALRFGCVALMGSILGVILAMIFAKPMLIAILKTVGMTNFVSDIALDAYVTPMLVITLSFAMFAYMFSSKIKTVEVRELITE